MVHLFKPQIFLKNPEFLITEKCQSLQDSGDGGLNRLSVTKNWQSDSNTKYILVLSIQKVVVACDNNQVGQTYPFSWTLTLYLHGEASWI